MKGLFKSKPRTPADVVRQTRELLVYFDMNRNSRDPKREEKMAELCKNIREMKSIIYGNSESEPNSEACVQLTQEFFHPLLCLLDKCTSIQQIKQIQAQLAVSGLQADTFAASRIIAFCSISESPHLDYASLILEKLPNPNTICWNFAIRGYSTCRQKQKQAIVLYKLMLASNARPDNYTYPFLFKSCAQLSDIRLGNSLFGHALQWGLCSYLFVRNSLIHLFAVTRRLDDARKMFDESSVRDLVTWNTLVNAYAQCGFTKEALGLFWEMEMRGIQPDEVTMIGVVGCCAQLRDLELGRKFHLYVEENGVELTVRLKNALMDMHVKCGELEPAKALFDGMKNKTQVSWTTMIVGYAKMGKLNVARKMFDEMPDKDIVPWNALMAGYVEVKRGKEALELFHEMQDSHVKPDEITMVNILSACSQLGALDMGMWIHRFIRKHRLNMNVAVGTALVDMYAKCGNIEKSLLMFDELPEKNALTWTAIICALASHGRALDAIDHFLRMSNIGLQPDEVTFLGVLSACCHAGLVDKGRLFFTEMTSKFGITPSMKHYSCMVDLLGRAGLLREAEDLVNSMPIKPDVVVWGALFFAAKIYANVAIGERAAMRLIELDPHDSGTYVLLSNLYVESNMRHKADKIRMLMKNIGLDKVPGCSAIEVNGKLHEFLVRDKKHQKQEIYDCLTILATHMRQKSNLFDFAQIDPMHCGY